jgi:hypothetical protein
MPEFLEIVRLGVLGNLYPEWGIAARARNRGIVIAALFFLGQGEEFLR